jgi:hypothetical protein
MTTHQSITGKRGARLALVSLALLLALHLCTTAKAYPPGPYHVLYGTVRDQYGSPITTSQAQVVLQTPSGTQFSAPVLPAANLPGVNYVLKVPLDSGITPDLYQPRVQVPGASYKLAVVVGTVLNLPIEMTNYVTLGKWAQNTRVDLTLGQDSNGDGIPDAWELIYLQTVGLNLPLSGVNGNTTVPPNGLTLGQEYVLTTSSVPTGVAPVIVFLGFTGHSPILQFSTVTGRSYTVLGSPDLRNWTPVAFNLSTDTQGGPTRTFYLATGTASIEVYLAPPALSVSAQFYRVLVQ